MTRALLVGAFLAFEFTTASLAAAQENVDVRAAQSAYANLDYEIAIQTAQRALDQRLSRTEQAAMYELLGFSYAALDSTRQAVEAFRELIFLDPDREPDAQRVSPRITSLYASALGQVLVVRKLRLDSASFVGGRGAAILRFQVSQPASSVVTRIVGGGIEEVVDSGAVVTEGRVAWDGLRADGSPIPSGQYELTIEASSGRNQYASRVPLEVRHSSVDTLAHLVTVPGYTRQAEMEIPGRDWKPLGIATLFTAITAGAALALENTDLGAPSRSELGAVSVTALLTGFVLSLRRPDPVRIPANVLYNRLLDEELVRRNGALAEQNRQLRQLVMITVRPTSSEAQ